MQLKMAADKTNKLNHVTNDSSILSEFNSTPLNKTSEKQQGIRQKCDFQARKQLTESKLL